MLTRDEFRHWLRLVDACNPALDWVDAQPPYLNPEQLWATCPYGSWLGFVLYYTHLIRRGDDALRVKLIELTRQHSIGSSRGVFLLDLLTDAGIIWTTVAYNDRLTYEGDALYADYIRSRWSAQDVLAVIAGQL